MVMHNKRFATLYHKFHAGNFDSILHSTDLIKGLGKPLITMPEYESSPGLWIFTDKETGIEFFIWSDVHKKNAFKGTSIEVKIKPAQYDIFDKLFERFVKFLESKI